MGNRGMQDPASLRTAAPDVELLVPTGIPLTMPCWPCHIPPVWHTETSAAHCPHNGYRQHWRGHGQCQAHSIARLQQKLPRPPAGSRDRNNSSIPLKPRKEDWQTARNREKDIKVEVNALKDKCHWSLPGNASTPLEIHKLSKWNYLLQWLDYCFKRPLWNYLNFYQNSLKKTHALLILL